MFNEPKNSLFEFTFRLFPTNLGAESEELGEKFHQNLKVMEERYKGVCGSAMMTDYFWSLAR